MATEQTSAVVQLLYVRQTVVYMVPTAADNNNIPINYLTVTTTNLDGFRFDIQSGETFIL